MRILLTVLLSDAVQNLQKSISDRVSESLYPEESRQAVIRIVMA